MPMLSGSVSKRRPQQVRPLRSDRSRHTEWGQEGKPKILIGLTGNIACGKSTVLHRLAELGAYTIDADARVHSILSRDGEAYARVVEAFGPGILSGDGEIDRRALGRIVFSDQEQLRRLEAITHPIVRRVMEREIREADTPIVVLDAIKLFESGWADRCDQVWVVSCRRDQQLERLMHTRGYSRKEAEERISAQSPQEEKVARADVVIDNSGSLEETVCQVDEAWQSLQTALARA
jgi:dephospho-CoA kinase